MMRTRRLIGHGVRALTRYKLRTAFMMLGSFLGVAALTLVVSVGAGAQRKILKTARQLFGDSGIVILARGTAFMGGPRPDAARLTLDDIEALARELPEIDVWDPQQTLAGASARYGGASTTTRVLGQSERSARVWERSVTRGEYLDAASVRGSARVALVGETVVRELFGRGDPIGAEILIGSVPFRVMGVLEPLGTDVHGMDRDNEIVVPISTAMRRLMNVDTIALAKVLVRDPARLEETARGIGRILRERHALAADAPDDFTLMTAVEVRKMIASVERILLLYVPLAACVVLVVGSVVAAALMLASVNARVGEIGLRRAIGARPEDIRLQFLVEAAVTMLGGGIMGIAAGYLGAHAAASHLQLGDVFSWNAVAVGLIASAATGFLAGVVPARRAARLHPVDALR